MMVLMDAIIKAINDEVVAKGYSTDHIKGWGNVDFVDVRNAVQSLQVDIKHDGDSLLLRVYELDFRDGGLIYHHLRAHDLKIELDNSSPDLTDQIIASLDEHLGPPGS
jgi:hypothetical protein